MKKYYEQLSYVILCNDRPVHVVVGTLKEANGILACLLKSHRMITRVAMGSLDDNVYANLYRWSITAAPVVYDHSIKNFTNYLLSRGEYDPKEDKDEEADGENED